jgi:hypothetical protein
MARMLRRLLPIVTAVAFAATLLPAAAAPASAAKKKYTIKVLSLTRVTIAHDLKPKGKENRGDSIEFKDLLVSIAPLFGVKANKPVGFDQGTLTYTSPSAARLNGLATFPKQGTVKFKGAMKPRADGSNTVPIVNGTGKFARAKGVLIIGPGDQRSVNTFRFTATGPVVA